MAEARALCAAAQVVFLTVIDQAEVGYPASAIRWFGHDVAFAEAVGAKTASTQATASTAVAGTREARCMNSHHIDISAELLEELWSMRTSDEHVQRAAAGDVSLMLRKLDHSKTAPASSEPFTEDPDSS
jgi:hypothetical protein